MADAALLSADARTVLKRAQQGKSYWRRVWERLLNDKLTLAVSALLALLLIMVVFAPWFSVHDPYAGSVLRRLKPVGTLGHWLGTDEVGRDLWSRMLYGGRMSLLAGVVPVFLALLVGGFLGILAGYSGGFVNSAIMRLTDVLYAFPSILLAIAITGILGSGLKNTILALSICFILAAGLSFLGLGVTPPSAEWGLMLNNLRQALWVSPLVAALPGVMIFITSMCFNLTSDGLRQAMDVRL